MISFFKKPSGRPINLIAFSVPIANASFKPAADFSGDAEFFEFWKKFVELRCHGQRGKQSN